VDSAAPAYVLRSCRKGHLCHGSGLHSAPGVSPNCFHLGLIHGGGPIFLPFSAPHFHHFLREIDATCKGCLQKGRCTPAPSRKLFVHWNEPARQAVRALVGTPGYEHSRRTRYRIEALFAELKQRMRLQRVRLRRLWNVSEQFLLAATAQNLKRLVRFLVKRPPQLQMQGS
jgi:hypothetical protein